MDNIEVSKKRKFCEVNRKIFQRKLKEEKNKINSKIIEKRNGRQFDKSIEKEKNYEAQDAENIHEKLGNWAIQHNITTIALRDLLTILISFGFVCLPKDPRTLLKTPKNIQIEHRANGQMWYAGIKSNLCKLFRSLNENMTLNLNFHVDGVQIYKSAIKSFWPILAQLHG